MAIFVIGVENEGIEYILSAKATDITKENFLLNVLCWHHTNANYFKLAILVVDSSHCEYLYDF